jgi:hypothetical protein
MAKEFKVSVPHSLSQEDAQSRVRGLLQDLKHVYATQISDVDERWSGGTCNFSLKMFVFKIQGSIAVEPKEVVVRGKMPVGTGKYEDKVKSLIESRAKALLAPKMPKGSNPFDPPKLA